MHRHIRVTAGTILLVLLSSNISRVWAHGFGQRYDLPVPLWLYVTGAAAAVAFSFLVIGLFVRATPGMRTYPRLNLLRFPVGRLLSHPLIPGLLKLISVGFFLLGIATGLIGNQNPMQNLTPTLVWIIWWVGMAYISALGGNLWAVINPWKVIFEVVEGLYRRLSPRGKLFTPFPYPRALGVWPGFVLFLAFAWTELVYEGRAVPVNLAYITLGYSCLTWAGMFLFGKEQWLRHGEAFSLAFGVLARFAPTEIRVTDPAVCATCELDCRDRDGECINCASCFRRAPQEAREWNLRPLAVGLLRHETIPFSMMAFVLLILSTVTFDGFMATPVWARIESALYGLLPSLGGERLMVIQTLGLIAFFLLFLLVYELFGEAMALAVRSTHAWGELARAFAFSLVPIAIAYHLAHYFSFLLIQGQLIIPLLSDPFGFGWNLLGTAGYRLNIGIVGARFVWYTAVIAIVLGHIIAVYLAHVIALRALEDHRLALRSQYPMLVLMVGYTMISLWIMAQPIVESKARPSRTAVATAQGITIPEDALLPTPGTGVFQPVGKGKLAQGKLVYRLLNSLFHDGTRMTVADLLYPYSFAAKWGTRSSADDPAYDPYIARATSFMRRWLAGVRVVSVESRTRGFGELRLQLEIPVIEVYTNYPGRDEQQVVPLAPPWTSLPWPLLVLMEEAVERGWAAFSQEEARRRGIPWLDLVRDQAMKERLASLVETFAEQGYVPEALQRFVTREKARERWTALQKFYQQQGHFLVTNGPYRMKAWDEATVLQVFRDMSYPLGVGSFDKYAIPRQAYITGITQQNGRIEIRAEVEKIEKFLRTYEIRRKPLSETLSERKPEIPVCRYVVLDSHKRVVKVGTVPHDGKGKFVLDLQDTLPPGRYTILVTLYLNENVMNPVVRTIPYRVEQKGKSP